MGPAAPVADGSSRLQQTLQVPLVQPDLVLGIRYCDNPLGGTLAFLHQLRRSKYHTLLPPWLLEGLVPSLSRVTSRNGSGLTPLSTDCRIGMAARLSA
jgi:hypothetical protein